MFTGLIEDIGRVAAYARNGAAAVLTVTTSLPTAEISVGDSIAVNGACLTVTAKRETELSFDVSPETMASTTISRLGIGQNINLERALRLGDRMGGHIVTGHVDCIGRLARSSETSGNHVLEFTLPSINARHLISKGSVAVNGISLTINTAGSDRFTVNIIPHTWVSTTLSALRTGDEVNLETDIIGKYVERLTGAWKPGGSLSLSTLAENGFL